MSGNGGFQEKALQNRAAIAHISPTSNERMSVRTKTLDGRAIAVPPHQVAVLSEQPKVVYVNPQSAVPTTWAGSETYIDFQIPPELHILTGLVLRLPVDVGAGTASAVPPTPWWVSRIEVQAGKDTIETLYPEHLTMSAIGTKSYQEQLVDAPVLNYVANTYATTSALTPATSYDSDTNPGFYLPINCSLTQGKVFVSGFITPFRLRIFFPAVLNVSQDGGGTTFAKPVLRNNVQLYCYEQELSAINYEAKLREHRNGAVSYKVIINDRYTEAYNNMAPSQTFNQQLKAFKSLSAGLLIYITPQPANQNDAQAKWNSRVQVQSMELLDNVGRRMTETLRDDWLRWFVWGQNFNSNFGSVKPTYLIPFSSDVGETMKNGVNLGYEQLTTLEQLKFITPSNLAPTSGSVLGNNALYQYYINITSLNYAMLECNAGVPRVVFT